MSSRLDNQPEFTILLAGDDRTEVVRVHASTRHLAVRAAEASVIGLHAVEVLTRFDVAGRCGRCGAVVFADDRPVEFGDGVRCRDC